MSAKNPTLTSSRQKVSFSCNICKFDLFIHGRQLHFSIFSIRIFRLRSNNRSRGILVAIKLQKLRNDSERRVVTVTGVSRLSVTSRQCQLMQQVTSPRQPSHGRIVKTFNMENSTRRCSVDKISSLRVACMSLISLSGFEKSTTPRQSSGSPSA